MSARRLTAPSSAAVESWLRNYRSKLYTTEDTEDRTLIPKEAAHWLCVPRVTDTAPFCDVRSERQPEAELHRAGIQRGDDPVVRTAARQEKIRDGVRVRHVVEIEHAGDLRAVRQTDRLVEAHVEERRVVGVTVVDVVDEHVDRSRIRQGDVRDRGVGIAALHTHVGADADAGNRQLVAAEQARLPVRVLLTTRDVGAVVQRIRAAERVEDDRIGVERAGRGTAGRADLVPPLAIDAPLDEQAAAEAVLRRNGEGIVGLVLIRDGG